MVYSTSKCPNCGQVIRRQTNPVHEIGCPFEQCRYCRSVYLNSYKEEWITKSPIERVFFFLQIHVWARALMMPVLVIVAMAFLDMEINGKVIAVLWPILSVTWLIAGYFIHKKVNREDIEASLERTKDPDYVKQLQNAGFGIYPIADDKISNNTKNTTVNNLKSPIVTDSTSKTETVAMVANNENGSNSDSKEESTVQKSNTTANDSKEANDTTEKNYFSVEDMAGGMAEICLKELVDIMGICSKYKVPYDEKKLIVSVFAYFYIIWIFNFENIKAGQAYKLEEIYKEKFSLFNRKQFENEPFKVVIENEQLLAEQLLKVDRRVRQSYHANSYTFVDDGISDEFILEFVESQEMKEIIKSEIVVKILKDWALKASLAGKEIVLTDK